MTGIQYPAMVDEHSIAYTPDKTLSYTYDSMPPPYTATDTTASQTLIAGASYGPANELVSLTGASGGWGGESFAHNSIKQLHLASALLQAAPVRLGCSITIRHRAHQRGNRRDSRHLMISAARPVLAPAAGSTQSLSRSLSQLHPVSARCSPCTHRGLLVSPRHPLLQLSTGQFSLRIRHSKPQNTIQYPETHSGSVQ